MTKSDAHFLPTSTGSRARGRPRAVEKRRAVIEAAWSLFLRQGVQGTSLDAVARAAGVSRVTLYSHFPDKTALFEAAVRMEMDRLAVAQAPAAPDVPLRGVLLVFGQSLMHYLTSATVVGFYNVLAGELQRHADLARRFYDLGPGQTHENLTAILIEAAARGELELPDPALAAEQLVGMWQGLSNYRLALDLDMETTLAELDMRVEKAVDLFLKAYGAEPPNA